jgi:hypothetical protein
MRSRPAGRASSDALGDGLVAGALAWAVSGLPSTLHATAGGHDVLAPVRAAGTLLVPAGSSTPALLVAGALAHTGLSLGWAALLSFALPDRLTVPAGAGAGLAIAALDLGVVGRRYPAVADLPLLPQVADHVAFGTVVGLVVDRRRRRRSREAGAKRVVRPSPDAGARSLV